jgi:hypothetical protein
VWHSEHTRTRENSTTQDFLEVKHVQVNTCTFRIDKILINVAPEASITTQTRASTLKAARQSDLARRLEEVRPLRQEDEQ